MFLIKKYIDTNKCLCYYKNERRSDTMKKKLIDLGGLILFYFVLFVGVLLLNLRFSYINNNAKFQSYVGVNN